MFKWNGNQVVCTLRGVRVAGESLIPEDPTKADHNTKVLKRFVERIEETRKKYADQHRWSVLSSIALDVDCGYGRFFIAPGDSESAVHFRAQHFESPRDVQPEYHMYGSLNLVGVSTEEWKDRAMMEVNTRLSTHGSLTMYTDGKAKPKQGLLFRQQHYAGSDYQPWGSHTGNIFVHGAFTNSGIHLVSAEELVFYRADARNTNEVGAGWRITYNSEDHDPRCLKTQTNVIWHYIRATTFGTGSPVEIDGGPAGTLGDLKFYDGIYHAHSKGGVRPYILVKEGVHVYNMTVGGRCEVGPDLEHMGRAGLLVEKNSRIYGLDAREFRIYDNKYGDYKTRIVGDIRPYQGKEDKANLSVEEYQQLAVNSTGA